MVESNKNAAAVISVKNVYKNFKLPHEKAGSVKSIITGFSRNSSRGTTETQHALEDISFEIKKGEFFGIVGRNGSGKSTLLKILAGIYQPSSGSVETRGKLVPFIELGVGFNPELTGRENVYLNGAMLGFDASQIDAMYNDIVAFAELERFMDQKLKNYSSGMQVRLAFSMATRSEADILLVDEVLAVGDADFQKKCFDFFRKLKKNKKTVVFVSHDMNAVREYCDRAVLIDKSKLVACGTNSIIEQVKLPSIKKGQQLKIQWKVANIFNDDVYTIEPAVADGEDQGICEWWDNAAQFEVSNYKKTPYPVAPRIEMEMSE
jgi:ABC-2 type transport system ATP-binding protein